MLPIVQTALLWFGAVGCLVIGGVYFAFSCFIMSALGAIDRTAGVAAMQAVNEVILRSLFMPLFWGTTLASAALVVLAVMQGWSPQSQLIALAGILFVAGMFVVTVIFNVPLNDRLMAAPAGSPEAAAVWAAYLKTWTLWNHVRTVTCIAAGALYILALVRG